MLFSSVPFLFYFLPCVLLVYFLVPGTLKNGVLLLASLLFYGWGEPRYLLVMLAAIAQGYVFGLLIEKSRGKRRAGLYLALSVLLSLGTLAYFILRLALSCPGVWQSARAAPPRKMLPLPLCLVLPAECFVLG